MRGMSQYDYVPAYFGGPTKDALDYAIKSTYNCQVGPFVNMHNCFISQPKRPGDVFHVILVNYFKIRRKTTSDRKDIRKNSWKATVYSIPATDISFARQFPRKFHVEFNRDKYNNYETMNYFRQALSMYRTKDFHSAYTLLIYAISEIRKNGGGYITDQHMMYIDKMKNDIFNH